MTDITLDYGTPPTRLSIAFEQCEVLTIENALSGYTDVEMTFTINGHIVHVIHGAGDDPDTFYITPAVGFWASEDVLVIADNQSGAVEICSDGMS